MAGITRYSVGSAPSQFGGGALLFTPFKERKMKAYRILDARHLTNNDGSRNEGVLSDIRESEAKGQTVVIQERRTPKLQHRLGADEARRAEQGLPYTFPMEEYGLDF